MKMGEVIVLSKTSDQIAADLQCTDEMNQIWEIFQGCSGRAQVFIARMLVESLSDGLHETIDKLIDEGKLPPDVAIPTSVNEIAGAKARLENALACMLQGD